MIDNIFFTNVNGESFTLNDTYAPVHKFNTAVQDRTNERNKSEQHGVWPAFTYLGKRTISIEGNLFGDSSADYITRRRAMKRVFTPRPQFGIKKTGTLYVQPTGFATYVSLDCTVDGDPELPIEALAPFTSTFLINLKAFDPRFYGLVRNVDLFTPSSGSGRGYAKTFPYTYAGSSRDSDTLVTNLGDIETYPEVTIYGPATSPQITLFRSDGNDLTVILDSLVLGSSADYVTVNMKFRTAVMNTGQNVYYTTTSSQWWALEPGSTNTVRYTAASYDPSSHANFRWQDAYML